MGIEWKKDHSRTERIRMVRVVIPTVGETLHVVIGHNQIFWRTVSMHHDVTLNRQVPCLSESCSYCPQPSREVTYVPCLLAKGATPGGRFNPRIIPITDGFHEILEAEHETNVFKITRHSKNSPCRWQISSTLATYGLTAYPGIEIEPSLRRMWGVKEKPTA